MVFTRDGVRAVDRAATQDFAMPGVALMENAASALLAAALRTLEGREGGVVICCGPGNNGGDGFALARRLANAGRSVACVAGCPLEKIAGDAGVNLRICQRMGIPIEALDAAQTPDAATASLRALAHRVKGAALVVDALLGTGLEAPLREPIRSVVAAINRLGDEGSRVLAVDIPTGLDCDTGQPLSDGPDAVVEADVTVTFCGLKIGFGRPGAAAWLGRVVVGDIGAPVEALRRHCAQ